MGLISQQSMVNCSKSLWKMTQRLAIFLQSARKYLILPFFNKLKLKIASFHLLTWFRLYFENLTRTFFFLPFYFFRAAPVPRLRVKSKPQLSAYATATATRDLSWVCDLHHSSWQRWILNPMSKARDQTHMVMGPSLGSLTAEPGRELLNRTFWKCQNGSQNAKSLPFITG